MEPNKLERHFKEQLNSREIKPSEMAWSKLDAMLTAADPSNSEQANQKPKTKFRWLFMAASFVGFLLVSTVYFKSSETVKINKDTPVVLEQKTDRDNLNEPEIINETVLLGQIQKPRFKEREVTADNTIQKKHSNELSTKEEEVAIITQATKNNLIVNYSENKSYPETSNNRYVSAAKLLAEVSNTKFETKDSDKTIEKTRIGVSVNPNILLSNAESELNQSFKKSALDKFSKNFNAIKTVLVNRNYE
jgi:hypothetical protein